MDNRLDPIYEELDRYRLSKDEILLRYYNICKDYKCETCIFKEFSMDPGGIYIYYTKYRR